MLITPAPGVLGQRLVLGGGRAAVLDAALRPRRGTEEFFGVRHWRDGESEHLVHWKLTARRGMRVLRELEVRADATVHVVLSTFVARSGSGRELERAVRLAATVVAHCLRAGRRTRLSVTRSDRPPLGPLRGRVGLARALNELAVVGPSDSNVDLLDAVLDTSVRENEVVVAVTSAPLDPPRSDVLVLDASDPGNRVLAPARRERAG